MNQDMHPQSAPEAANAVETAPEPAPQPALQYTGIDSVFAWVCFVFGYLFCRAFPPLDDPMGAFLFVLVLFVATYVVLKLKKAVVAPSALFTAIAAVGISASMLLTENRLLVSLSYLCAMAGYFYFVYAATGNCLQGGFSDLVVADYFKALFVMPFCSLSHIYRAIATNKSRGGAKVLLKILAGVAITFIPTIIVLSQLSYDDGFTSILRDIFDFNIVTVMSHIGSLMLAVPIGMYIFGAYGSGLHKRAGEMVTADGWQQGVRKLRVLSPVTAVTAVVPILFLYAVYFISQWKYYVSGFTGVLPDEFGYAEYARDGFFQLCTVSAINLVLIVLLVLLMKRGETGGAAMLLRGLAVVFCLCTLVLISTAVAKLVMYIDCFGLTQKRVYAMWLMLVIAVVYLLVAVGLFLPRLKTVAISLTAAVAMFAVLALSGVNGIIADYNVDRYLDGSLSEVDLSTMDDLGNASVPALVRLAKELESRDPQEFTYEERLLENVDRRLRGRALRFAEQEQEFFSFDFPTYFARQALRDYPLGEE